jgi:hypothetical protein
MNVTTAANLSHVPGPISIAAVICRNLAAPRYPALLAGTSRSSLDTGKSAP